MSEELPAELQRVIADMPSLITRDRVSPVTRIPLYANCCGHEIERYGNEWRCSEKCRCMMIGCVPKVWSSDAH